MIEYVSLELQVFSLRLDLTKSNIWMRLAGGALEVQECSDMELQEQKITEQDILTQQELYEYLPLGRTTIQKLLQQKILPAIKIGRNYLITKRKLLEWLDENAGNEFNID